jgi:hypothetical protein
MFDRFKNKMKNIGINISKRSEDSIGMKVLNKIEIHYTGPPYTFSYNGPIDEITVDEFQHSNNLDKLQVDLEHFQYQDEKGNDVQVSDDEKIADFNASKIRYYKLFSKKTLDINYLVTYDLDLIQTSSQKPYTETTAGMKHLKNFQLILMLAAMILMNILLDSIAASTYQTSYTVNQQNVVNYYIPLTVILAAVFILYIQHIRDLSKTMVHSLTLAALPMKIISANGVLPVVLTDSQIKPLWSYQAKLMNINPGEAQKVIAALQDWKADQLETAFVNSKITEKNISLMKLQNEQRYLSAEDLRMYAEQDKHKRWIDMLIGGMVASFVAVIVFFSLL